MTASAIPFNRATAVGSERDYLSQALSSGRIAGDQVFSRKCQAFIEGLLGVKRALVTTSCTHALEMCALLLHFAAGDEVIVPSFTFVSTVNAFAMRGARPVFADIRADTFNLDESHLESLISPRAKAIVVVHYAGIGCEMDAILSIAARHGVPVVEDNAHGLFGKYKGQWLGTFGCLATQSFHETKNITCGEGGALLINDPGLVQRAEIIREKGTNRSRFFRGEIDKYSWVDRGSSYVISDLLAAVLLAQLEHHSAIQECRCRIWQTYRSSLFDWAHKSGVRLPFVPPHCDQAYHMFSLLMPTPDAQGAMIAHLKAHDIMAVFHYLPLHLSEYAAQWGGKPGDCPVTEDTSERLVRLPFFTGLTPDDQNRVIDAVCRFRP